MQPSDRVNIKWIQHKDAVSNKYEATWSNGEKTYTITVGIPKGLSDEYVKGIIEEHFKEFKVNDMDELAKNKFRYDPLKKNRESKTFTDIRDAADSKSTESYAERLTGCISGMFSSKDDFTIEAEVMPSPNFELLPDEMVLPIMMNLSVKEIVRMRKVNKRFWDIGGEVLEKKISDENFPLAELGGDAKILAFLKSLHPENRLRIRQLNLSGTKINNSFLARLSSLTPNLQDLNLTKCPGITDHGLEHLASLKELRNLSLEGCDQITDDGLKHLASLTELRSLSLAKCRYHITKDGLQHLAPLKQLRNLSLEDCFQINNDGLKHLAPLTELRSLSLEGCRHITDDGLKHLAPFKKLRNLSLEGCYDQISDDSLQRLAPLTELRSLSLAKCFLITNDGLKHLAPLKELQNLSLKGCDQITFDAKILLENTIPGLTVIS